MATQHPGNVPVEHFFHLPPHVPHLHHQHNGVESNHGQDGVLKRRRYHKMPQTVLESVPILGHVTCEGLGTDGKIYARPLKSKAQEEENRKMNETAAISECNSFVMTRLFVFAVFVTALNNKSHVYIVTLLSFLKGSK